MKDRKVYEFNGYLASDSFENSNELSNFIRQSLSMPFLWCFDAQSCNNYYDEDDDEKKHIYLSVCFKENSKTYYYQTDDRSIKVGDKVLVPVGEYDIEKIVDVVKVEHYDDDNLPMPLKDVKFIFGKITPPNSNIDKDNKSD